MHTSGPLIWLKWDIKLFKILYDSMNKKKNSKLSKAISKFRFKIPDGLWIAVMPTIVGGILFMVMDGRRDIVGDIIIIVLLLTFMVITICQFRIDFSKEK